MKKLLLILPFILLLGCEKESIRGQNKEIIHDDIRFFTKGLEVQKRLKTNFYSYRKNDKIPKGANVILFDFDGGVCSNTSWNVNGDIRYQPANLSPDEQKRILDSVAHDYAPFNIYVTTSEVAYNNASKKMRVIFTTTYEWYGTSAGGVAYTGSINWNNDTPCWVFTSLLGYNLKSIQEAASHEAGHTFGLRHQASYDENCNQISPYNYGTEEIAPIMGVAYKAMRGEWWVGPTSLGCNNIQNDKEIIASVVGYK
jgi:hypothetical protein